ncbi:MAG TPA: GNAT family N-acetyltransferase [Gemmatimonadales bacterium]
MSAEAHPPVVGRPAPVRPARDGEARARVGVRVRRGLPADIDVVVELRLALLREHAGNPIYGRLRRDARSRAERLFAAQLAARGEVTFLAEKEGEVVGILRCIDAQGSPLLHPDRYGYIASVYVRPAVRRSGVLRALVASAERWCERRGLTELRLHNAADNELASAAWSGLGFEVAEVLRVRPLHPRGG